MITAYFIGGSRDLSKQVLDNESPLRTISYFKPEPFSLSDYDEKTAPKAVMCKRELYRLVGPLPYSPSVPPNTFVYQYEKDE